MIFFFTDQNDYQKNLLNVAAEEVYREMSLELSNAGCIGEFGEVELIFLLNIVGQKASSK